MALAVKQLNKQAVATFSNLDVLRITLPPTLAGRLKKEMRQESARQ
jgi:hypothetical protein